MHRDLGPDELHEVYAAIGAAIWQMQFLEDALAMSITMRLKLKAPGMNADVALAELKAQQRKTLGALLQEAEGGNLLDATMVKASELLRRERNWLVHDSMRESNDTVYTNQGREELLVRVRSINEQSITHKKALTAGLFEWLSDQGIDVPGIGAATEIEFRRSRSRSAW